MRSNEISSKEQKCISACILKYWSDSDIDIDDEHRNKDYEQCLTECNVCS